MDNNKPRSLDHRKEYEYLLFSFFSPSFLFWSLIDVIAHKSDSSSAFSIHSLCPYFSSIFFQQALSLSQISSATGENKKTCRRKKAVCEANVCTMQLDLGSVEKALSVRSDEVLPRKCWKLVLASE